MNREDACKYAGLISEIHQPDNQIISPCAENINALLIIVLILIAIWNI